LTCGWLTQTFTGMEWITNPEIWISLVTLTLLEIVLGIDNIVFISILSGKLPADQQKKARRVGLGLALITRILLLVGLAWMVRLTNPLFTLLGQNVSGRDLILLSGGLFLLGKATHEIHDRLEGEDGAVTNRIAPRFTTIVVQILLLDIVFSLDSVITAVGMVRQIPVMIAAVIIAMIFMLIFVNDVSTFIDRHPTIKMLALSFLILIGCALIAEGLHREIPKGYIYFAMAFSLGVEMLNIRTRARAKAAKVALHQPYR
jgi:predicted tellurium resistance membrane protein TerC